MKKQTLLLLLMMGLLTGCTWVLPNPRTYILAEKSSGVMEIIEEESLTMTP